MGNDDTTKQLPAEDRLDSLIALVHQIASDVRDIKARQENLEARQENLEIDVKDLKARQENLGRLIEQRLYDTRPIWEGVQADVAEIKTIIRKLDKKVDILHDDLINLRTEQRDLEDRVESLERKSS